MRSLAFLAVLISFNLAAQTTKTITITGDIAKPIVVNFSELNAYKSFNIDSLQILNHKQEYKSTLKKIQGVLLKDVLNKVEFTVNSPKVLSEFYIVCIADDGYKVIFSWNEIFNSPTGDRTLILTAVNGETAVNRKEGIILLTPTDKATGRRYVKNLSSIRIQQFK